MATNISHNAEETERLGESWGRRAGPGLTIGLTGELGAGKTQLVKGLARGLGIQARVHSPTFNLVNIYEGGRLPLVHIDLYRLVTRAQIAGAGLEEHLHGRGLAVIEWADRWWGGASVAVTSSVLAGLLPFRWVKIEILGETERRIEHEDFGA